jgi:hypothetical protein
MVLRTLRNQKSLILIRVFPLFLLVSKFSQAGDFRIGGGVGFGGGGVTKTVEVQSTNTSVQRSEGPGTISIFVDYLLSDRFTVGLDHSRGFRLGPASSGVAFTSFVGRWYFLGPVPSVKKGTNDTTLLVKRITPFFGLAAGVASASISRENDVVPEMSSSGIFYGYRLGLEYSLAPGLGFRPEIVYSSTLSSASESVLSSSGLSFFSVQMGLFIFL